VKHPLKLPVPSLDGKTKYTVLEVRDHLTVGDLLAARRLKNVDPLEQDVIMVARICQLDPAEVESLDYVDLCVIQAHLGRLFAAGAEAAEASAPKG
jgi:hypothetical protein